MAIPFSRVLLILLFNQCRKPRMPHVLFSQHHAIKNCTSLLQQLHWLPISELIKYKTACTMRYNSINSSAPLTFLKYCSCTAFPTLSTLHQTHAYSNSDASTAKLMAFALSPISVLTSGTTSPKTSDTLLLSLPSKTKLKKKYFLWTFQLSNTVLPSPQQSV